MERSENPFPNARVLIIEDDEEMRSLLKDFFAEERFETDSAGYGHDAFGILIKKMVDLVVTYGLAWKVGEVVWVPERSPVD